MIRILLLTLLLLFTFSACKKDPSTFPAKVQFSFGLIPLGADDVQKDAVHESGETESNFLIIDDGTLVISKIEFEGRRKDANDVFFSADFDPPIIVDLKEGTASRSVRFDIPQGIYERIEMIFFLGAPGHLPLLMTGEANLPILGSKLVRFEYQYSEPVRVLAQGITGNQIVLRKDVVSHATLSVNAEHLFRLVNPGLLIAAEILNDQDEEVILIAQGMNTPIFNVIANRLSQSFEVTFE